MGLYQTLPNEPNVKKLSCLVYFLHAILDINRNQTKSTLLGYFRTGYLDLHSGLMGCVFTCPQNRTEGVNAQALASKRQNRAYAKAPLEAYKVLPLKDKGHRDAPWDIRNHLVLLFSDTAVYFNMH